jgi:cytoskeletal protein CcmA (bactofilin family)
MKPTVKRLIGDEKGRVLTLALLLLVLGGLVLTPLLGLMTTGLAAGEVFEKKTDELYAADAGVENAIWHLQQAGDPHDVLEPTVNGKSVSVALEELPHDCNELATYEITSTATSADGSSTTVLSQVTNITVYYGELFLDHNAGTVYYPSNVYVDGDVTLSAEVHIVGNFKAGGDVILNQGSLIGGIVCVGGSLTLNNNATIEADVYVAGDLTLNNLAIIESDLNIGGNVYLGGSTHIDGYIHTDGGVIISGQEPLINGNVWANNGAVSVNGKKAKIDGDVYAGGAITGSGIITGTQCPMGACGQCEIEPCPLNAGEPDILLWVII